jgi:repressor LexA
LTAVVIGLNIESMSGFVAGYVGRAYDHDPRYPGLTGRQRDIVCFCTDHIERNGYPPTLREIGTAVGLRSPSGVAYQVKELKRKGYLSSGSGQPRTTMPRMPARETAPRASPGPGEYEGTPVQVVGRIAAGERITAMDLAEEYVYLPPGIAGTHEHFALEVVGDSMIGKAILSGDRVVVRYGCEARNGDTVVARFDDSDTSPEEGEATLKTLKRVGGHVWLLPENPAYDPILGDEATILGKVVYVSRTLR